VIQVRDVFHRYGRHLALSGVSLHVPSGQCVALVGPNGAGKSTLLRLMAGALVPQRGTVQWGSGGVGFVPDRLEWPPGLTARRHLQLLAPVLGLPADQVNPAVEGALARTDLLSVAHHRVETFSLGLSRRMGLAQLLLAPYGLWVLDEPLRGLDLAQQQAFAQVLQQRPADTAVVISTHSERLVERLCDEMVALREGQVVGRSSVTHVPDVGAWILDQGHREEAP